MTTRVILVSSASGPYIHYYYASLHMVNSKDEAIAACNTYPEKDKHLEVEVYRDGPEGNDIFYSCKDSTEHPSTFNRSEKCDPTTFKPTETPIGKNGYRCDHGRLVLLQCRVYATAGGPMPVCSPLEGYN